MMNNDLLQVPSEAQIKGFDADNILNEYFPRVESQQGKGFQCKYCKAILSPSNTWSKLRNHLISHAKLVESGVINQYEQADAVDKVRCKVCTKELKFRSVAGHSAHCKHKTNDRSRNTNQNKEESLLNKRTSEEAFQMGSTNVYRDYDRNELNDLQYEISMKKDHAGQNYKERKERGEEEEKKIEKKVKRDEPVPTINGRGPASLKSQLFELFKTKKNLPDRAFKLELAKILDPFEQQWESEKKRCEEEIEKLKRDYSYDKEEKEKKIQELQDQVGSLVKDKKDLENMMLRCEENLKNELSRSEIRFAKLEQQVFGKQEELP